MAMGKDVIIAKHGRKDNWSSNTVILPCGVGPWKYISKLSSEFPHGIQPQTWGWSVYQGLEGSMAQQYYSHGGISQYL